MADVYKAMHKYPLSLEYSLKCYQQLIKVYKGKIQYLLSCISNMMSTLNEIGETELALKFAEYAWLEMVKNERFTKKK